MHTDLDILNWSHLSNHLKAMYNDSSYANTNVSIMIKFFFIMNSHDVPNFDLSPTMMNIIQSRGSSINHIVAGL